MRSKIFLSEKVVNKDRRFGSALNYYPVEIHSSSGKVNRALFTIDQIREAVEREDSNKEDFRPLTFWERVTAWLRG